MSWRTFGPDDALKQFAVCDRCGANGPPAVLPPDGAIDPAKVAALAIGWTFPMVGRAIECFCATCSKRRDYERPAKGHLPHDYVDSEVGFWHADPSGDLRLFCTHITNLTPFWCWGCGNASEAPCRHCGEDQSRKAVRVRARSLLARPSTASPLLAVRPGQDDRNQGTERQEHGEEKRSQEKGR